MDEFIKFGTFVGALIGAGKMAYEIFMTRRGDLRSDYRFAKEFFSDLSSGAVSSPYLKNKGYQALIGNSSLTGDEVEYLVSLKDAEGGVKDFIAGRSYLEFDKEENLIVFRGKYSRKWSRCWRKCLYIALYAIAAIIACSPIFYDEGQFENISQMISFSILVFVVFGFYAILAVRAGAKISRAERLVGKQHPV